MILFYVYFLNLLSKRPRACNSCGGQKKELGPLVLGLHLIVNHHVDTGNRT